MKDGFAIHSLSIIVLYKAYVYQIGFEFFVTTGKSEVMNEHPGYRKNRSRSVRPGS